MYYTLAVGYNTDLLVQCRLQYHIFTPVWAKHDAAGVSWAEGE